MSTAIRESDVNDVAREAGLTPAQTHALRNIAASSAMEGMPQTLDELRICAEVAAGRIDVVEARRRATVARKPEEREGVISGLQSFEWSSEESVACEAAVEALNEVVGAYAARIVAEQAKPAPDRMVVAEARAARADCARWRDGLDPSDHGQISAARREFSDLVTRSARPGR